MEQIPARYTTKLQNITKEYDDVYTFIFDKPEGLIFKSGSYAHVFIPTVEAPEKKVREISFSSAPNDNELALTIITKSNSPWKQKLLELKTGDQVELFKIKGYLESPKDRKLILIANGIGVTPFRSILREHFQQNTEMHPILVHFGRDNYLFEDEFSKLDFEQHRIVREQSEEVLNPLVENNKDAIFMVAGAPNFVESMSKNLIEKGITENQIQTDTFDGLDD